MSAPLPTPHECHVAAAGQLNLAAKDGDRCSYPDGQLILARAMTAIGYLMLAEAQGPMLSPDDQASWSPDEEER